MKKSIEILFYLALIITLAACVPGTTVQTNVPKTDGVSEIVANETNPVSSNPANQCTTQTTPRTVTVSGVGKVYIIPDIAYITIGVNNHSNLITEALASNNSQSQAVRKALEDAGVDAKDIQTTSFNVYPNQQFDTLGKITSTDYVVDNSVLVTVRNLDKLSNLLETVIRSGANSINSINFDSQDKEKAYSNSRELAVSNARKQAEELAKANGVTLGKVDTIQVIDNNFPGISNMNYNAMGMGGAGAAQGMQVPVSAGQLMISVTVNLTFEIQ